MLKSSFAKYLLAFVAIIFTAFLILSYIITSMIRGYVNKELDDKLILTSELVVDSLESLPSPDLTSPEYLEDVKQIVTPIINFDSRYEILISDTSGKVVLTSIGDGCVDEDGNKIPLCNCSGGFFTVNIGSFRPMKEEDRTDLLVYRGNLDGTVHSNSLVYARPVIIEGEHHGYVFSVASTDVEDKLVALTRRVVINSSIWVMLAAVIAAYFITERIMNPLRVMTVASKKFAKGDFSTRVNVYGNDEVAELGRAFNNMAESLDSLEKMRNSFLANVSHDLRTPMTTISGFIDGINSGAIPPEKHEYYLGVISAEVHRLSRLVSQLLDISRLESGERKFTFSHFDICEISRIILISFEQKIEDKRLEVEFICDDDAMFVNADKDAIYQVIYNLCHNAIKFSKEQGKFKISINRIAGEKICVSVFDEGESIAGEDTKMVFERFYKTDKSRGLDKNGVGLGLYICKTIIDAHEETIAVESVEGESTEFYFTLKEVAPPARRKPQ